MTKNQTMKNKTRPDSPRLADARRVRFAFFGTPELAAVFLDDLEKNGYVPSLVVTTPDRAQGRGMTLQSPPVKKWADARDIPTLQPERLDENFETF